MVAGERPVEHQPHHVAVGGVVPGLAAGLLRRHPARQPGAARGAGLEGAGEALGQRIGPQHHLAAGLVDGDLLGTQRPREQGMRLAPAQPRHQRARHRAHPIPRASTVAQPRIEAQRRRGSPQPRALLVDAGSAEAPHPLGRGQAPGRGVVGVGEAPQLRAVLQVQATGTAHRLLVPHRGGRRGGGLQGVAHWPGVAAAVTAVGSSSAPEASPVRTR